MAKSAESREQYESYEGFLRAAIRTYWEQGARSKVNFLALLLASKEAWSVAWSKVSGPGAGKKILTGAAGATALALLLRAVVGGPIGILLTGASIASLVAIYVKNHERIWAKVKHYGALIDEYRTAWEQNQSDWTEGGLSDNQHELVVDGLMSRFLVSLDEFEPDDDVEEEDDDEDGESFAAHAERKREEAEAKKAKKDGDAEGDDS
jgi:hypothetical protein